jgi:hypothetical protein
MQVSLFNSTRLRFNITEFSVKQLAVNNNRVKIRFNEQTDMVEITQDDIDMELEFSYRGYMIPPVFADKGKIRVSIEDVGFTADIGVETGE